MKPKYCPWRKYRLHQGKPGRDGWRATGALKSFKDPREMHSKHTPKQETGMVQRETIISSSSFDPTRINRETEESIEKTSATLISFANFLSCRPGWEFPGGLQVRTLCFHCRGPGFDPGGELNPTCHAAWQKKESRPGLEQGRSFTISISNRVVTNI